MTPDHLSLIARCLEIAARRGRALRLAREAADAIAHDAQQPQEREERTAGGQGNANDTGKGSSTAFTFGVDSRP